MGPDQPENNNVIIKMKRKSIVHGYGAFPNVMCSLDFLDSQTRVMQIFLEKAPAFHQKPFEQYPGAFNIAS